MSVIVLTSAGHAPGVTTTALGLALCWPRPVVLVDADPHPTQAVLAGYLQGADPFGKGLWTLLSAHRERRPVASVLPGALMDLPSPDGVQRRFLPGFTSPGMVELFTGAWVEFAVALASQPDDVLVDAGRIGSRGLPPALVETADAVLVVTGTTLVDLVGLRLHLSLLAAVVPEAQLSLLLIGPGRPYTASEIGTQFGLPVADPVPWAPAEARVWSHGAAEPRRFAASGYVRAVRRTASGLAERLERSQLRIGAPR